MNLSRRWIWPALPLLAAAAAAVSGAPNIVVVLVDDLGWADLGCYGSTFYSTPHIDRLAGSGVRFTQAYAAAPVCSPTRAALLTGRHPVRVDITDWIPGMHPRDPATARFRKIEDRSELALEEVTLAELLRERGYQTWHVGKWHLGADGFLPTDQGFEVNIGGHNFGQPPRGYFSPYHLPGLPDGPDGEYLGERLAAEAVRLIEQRDPARPFFLHYADYNVHTPLHANPRRIEAARRRARALPPAPAPIPERAVRSRARQDHPEYSSMVAAVDDAVGRLLDRLETLGLTTNTVVVFTSDNGGLCTSRSPGPTCNLPLRAGKGWLYEGGIRVPLIIRAPAVTVPGLVCDLPTITMDLAPTLLELAGVPPRPDLHLDGISLVPVLRGPAPATPRQLVWHYPHYHGSGWTPGAAIRLGDWKLIEFYEEDRAELYNLRDDPGERRDRAAEEPGRVAELRRRLADWQRQTGARMPEPNPQWTPASARRAATEETRE
ncbi:MAG: sulfatase [Kiritimatiellae bacterium]|nr:sulfatase [Kiritimatiellia bacterium]